MPQDLSKVNPPFCPWCNVRQQGSNSYNLEEKKENQELYSPTSGALTLCQGSRFIGRRLLQWFEAGTFKILFLDVFFLNVIIVAYYPSGRKEAMETDICPCGIALHPVKKQRFSSSTGDKMNEKWNTKAITTKHIVMLLHYFYYECISTGVDRACFSQHLTLNQSFCH